MNPPVAGTFSTPRQSRRVNMFSKGFTMTTTSRYQNPILRGGDTPARMPDMTAALKAWAVVVPVKRLSLAKTRIALAPDLRAELALAMALDTVAACLACPAVGSVVAVTDDERASTRLQALGAHVVGDEPDAGLNPALRYVAGRAQEQSSGSPVLALSSDLPALSGQGLAGVLAVAARHRSACVADASGQGTTVLAASSVDHFHPDFGGPSWHRHVEAGAVDLTGDASPRVRRD